MPLLTIADIKGSHAALQLFSKLNLFLKNKSNCSTGSCKNYWTMERALFNYLSLVMLVPIVMCATLHMYFWLVFLKKYRDYLSLWSLFVTVFNEKKSKIIIRDKEKNIYGNSEDNFPWGTRRQSTFCRRVLFFSLSFNTISGLDNWPAPKVRDKRNANTAF